MVFPELKRRSRECLFAAALSVILAGLISDDVLAGEINTGYFGSVAIEGYDPVAYFKMNKAVRGSEQFTHNWLGAIWQFANAEHRDLFENNPISYAPQYGGYCSDGMAYGTTTANLDPQAFRIIEGKLYLNHDQGAAMELVETPGQITKADAMWKKQRGQLVKD